MLKDDLLVDKFSFYFLDALQIFRNKHTLQINLSDDSMKKIKRNMSVIFILSTGF